MRFCVSIYIRLLLSIHVASPIVSFLRIIARIVCIVLVARKRMIPLL
jgi:hypothetical protein